MDYWNIGKTEKKQKEEDRGRSGLSTLHSIIPVFHSSGIPSFLSSALLVFCSLVLVFLSGAEVRAATCTATAGTNWATATWSGCTGPPTNADDAIINSGINLTITTAAICGSLTIGPTRATTTLTIGSGGSLSVTTAGARSGNLSLNPGGYTNRTYTLDVGAQSATIDGTVTLSTNTSVITVSSGSISFTNAGGLTWANGILTLSGAGSASFSGPLTHGSGTIENTTTAGTFNFNGGYTKSGGTFTTISGTNVNFGGALSVSGSALTLNTGSNSTFTGSGNITPTTNLALGNVTVNTGVTATTVSAAGTFTIAGNLALNGTGTLAGTEPVLLTGSGTTLDGSGTLSAASTVSAAHTVNSTANMTISGTMTINNGITVTNNGTVAASNLGAGTGTWLQNAGTAVLNYSGSSITPTLTATASGNTVNYNAGGGQTVKQTNYHHLQLSTSGTKTFASGTTGIAGNMTIGGTATADATTNSTTIDYNGGGAQNVGAINYYNLSLSNAGTKTFASGTTGIANTFSIGGTAGADATTNSATIDYNGSGAQSVRAINYYNVTLSNAGTKTLASGTTGIANTFSIGGTAGADATTNSATIDYNGSGAQSVRAINYYNVTLSNAGTKTLASGTTGIANTFSIGGTAGADATTNSATIDYNGSGAQSVVAMNYHHLTLSNAGTKTIAASTSVAGNLATSETVTASCSGSLSVTGNVTIGSGTSFNGGSGTIDIGGNLTAIGTGFTSTSGNLYVGGDFSVTAGSFTHNSGTIILNGNDKTISAAGAALNNLQVSGLRAITLGSSLTVQGTVSVTSGYLVQDPSFDLWAGAITIGANGGYRNWGTGTLTLGGNVSNNGAISFNGGGDGTCGSATESMIRSSIDGTRRLWSGSGTFDMVDVDVKDQGGTAGITVYSGTSTGGNNDTNWIFLDTCTGAPTAVELIAFTAMSTGTGEVLLAWRTGYEVDNLGFHIYREENGELFRVTPELIAGSAFLTGTGTPLTVGRSYVWIDASASQGLRTAALEDRPAEAGLEEHPAFSGVRGKEKVLASSSEGTVLLPQGSKSRSLSHAEGMTVAYWLEDWDLNGKKTLHGPVTPVRSDTPLLKYGNVTLLSMLGKRQNQKYDEFWRIQEIRERLQQGASPRSRTGPSGLEERPFGTRGPAPKGGLEAVASNLKPQATSEAERSLTVSGSAKRSLRTAQALASQPGIKIGIREQGWYRVTQPELLAAGLDPAVSPRRLRLYADGKEQAILVSGEEDGHFDAADSIEFYGIGQDTPYTDTRVYWLLEGARPGKRIKTKQGKNGGSASQNFPHTVEVKERIIYFAALKNGDTENFFGAIVSSEGTDQILNITNPDTSAPGEAMLEVALQGGTSVSHRVKVFVNDAEVTEMRFDSTVRSVMTVALPQSWLLEGENLVSLVAQGGDVDVSVVDYLRLTYWHTYTADQDSLLIASSGGREVAISGFTNSRIRVADITDPRRVYEVTGGVVEPEEPGYRVRFGAAGSGNRTVLAFTEAAIKSPASITMNQPSMWHKAKNRADFIIITHQDFIGSLGPLKSLRESQGWSVALIDVQDLYDEFSFGAKTPQALKDFLQSARGSSQRSPRFVLLVGDASFDPRNYLGLGDVDFVPTKLVDTASNETASDDWFVDFKGDGLPTLAAGRIPARTQEEAVVVVSKLIAYENAEAGTWNRQAVMIADKTEEGDSFDFEGASAEVETLLPESVTSQRISRGQGNDGAIRAQIIEGINEGRLLVNYIGHGSVEIWRGGIFSSDDVATLTNGARLPFFITMTCLNGYFHDPFPTESLAESLLKAGGGGAIAVWASSGLTDPEGQALMNKKLISLLFDGTAMTLGEATVKAKAATENMDVRRTWILFGDPTTRLKQ